jgi:hypothetical protein
MILERQHLCMMTSGAEIQPRSLKIGTTMISRDIVSLL